MEHAERVEDARLQFGEPVGVQEQRAVRQADRDQLAVGGELLNERLDAVGRDAGPADEVGGRAPRRPGEPRGRERADLRVVGPQPLDLFEHLQVPPADLHRGRLEDLPAAEGVLGRRVAEHERLAPHGRHRGVEEQLREF